MGLTADRITVAAADLADTVGLDNVTITALARGFGVADASLYSHVRNVLDLRERVAAVASAEFADRLGLAVAGRSGAEALHGFAAAYRGFALDHPGRYAAAQIPTDSPGGRRIMEICRALLHGYALPEPHSTDAVRLLRSALHGYASLEAAGAFQAARDVQVSWERGIAALHLTLERWPR